MTVFGPIVTDTHVEDLILAKLKLWLPSYLGQVGEETGRERTDMPDIRSWGTPAADLQLRPEQTTPHLAVLSGDTTFTGPDGDGYLSATVRVEVTVVVSANSFYAVDRLSKAYAAAVELCLLQQPVGGPVERITLVGHTPDDLPSTPNADRSMVAMTSRFDVYVSDVYDATRGPAAPQEEPREEYPPLGTVDTVDITIEQEQP